VYRQCLEEHPLDPWALKGLQQVLAAQGSQQGAAAVGEQLQQAWAHADAAVQLGSSCPAFAEL
jgi:hypothetical protein